MKTKRASSSVMYATCGSDATTVRTSARSDGTLLASFNTRSRRKERSADVDDDDDPCDAAHTHTDSRATANYQCVNGRERARASQLKSASRECVCFR
jgi:hypothetical protein